MARHFERFMDGPWKSSRDNIHVTLNNKGVFHLNRKAFELLGSPDAVALSFDKATSTIGLEKVQPRLTEAFPLLKFQDMAWRINAIPFYRYCGIRLEGTEAFQEPEINNDGLLMLDLRHTRRVHGGGGKRKKGDTNPTNSVRDHGKNS